MATGDSALGAVAAGVAAARARGAAAGAGDPAGDHPGAAGDGVPDRRAGVRAGARTGTRRRTWRWMAGLLVLSTLDVALGLRTLVRLRMRRRLRGSGWPRPRPGRCCRSSSSPCCCAGRVGRAGTDERGDESRSILITGSSTGIGRATAERFAARGWRVFASMRNPERGGGAAGAGRRARLAADDAARSTSPATNRSRRPSTHVLRETGGRLDVLINNAGYYAVRRARGDVARRAARAARDQRRRRACA